MIRRISKNNDYRDIIRSCPSGVVDDIYAVEYYVQGWNTFIQADYTKKGSLLEVILPSSELQTLPDGVLMRRALYSNPDPAYPDGNYNLEFVEDLGVWLEGDGTEPGPGPEPGEYVTEEELAETLEDYVTQDSLAVTLNDYVTETELDNVQQGIYVGLQNLDNRVTALEQGGGGGGVSPEVFAAHVESNNTEFNTINGELSQIGNTADAAYQAAQAAHDTATQAGQGVLQALDSAQQAISLATGADQAASTAQAAADAAGRAAQAAQDSVDQLSSIVGDLSDSTSDIDQRVTDIENAAFQDQIDDIDQRVTDLENQNNVQYNTDSPLYDGYNKVITTFEPGNGNTPLFILVNNENSEDAQYDGIKIDSSGIYKYSANNYEDPGIWTEYSDELATQDWVQNQGYATQQWVTGRGYLTSSSTLPADQITCNISGDVFDFDDVDEGLTALVSKVEEQIDDITSLDTRVTDLENAGYATETWVQGQGYITSSALSGYATQTWVQNQDYASDSDLDALDARVSVLEHGGSPVTLAWGGISGTITDQTDLVSYIGNQGFLTSSDLSGYATQSWVGQQGYITSSALSGYATESWATNQFLEESKVWTGTETQWNQLSAAQKASYTIALITQ